MRDVIAVGCHDLGGEINGEDDNHCVNDVARLRAAEQTASCVRIGLAELDDVAAAEEPAQLYLTT